MRWLLLLGALSGCDSVFGLDDTALPKCVRGSFDPASATALTPDVQSFSFTGDRARAVASIRGITVETGRDGDNAVPIDIEPMYPMVSTAAEPNGDYFFLTAATEPFTIFAITKTSDTWKFDPHVPKGIIAGTPTNRMSGKPVRVLVRTSLVQPVFQEYERGEDGAWMAVGDRFELNAIAGANLTQDGLAVVFDGAHDVDQRAVYIAQRATLDDAFAAPQLVLDGLHQQPQLFDDCGTLYALDADFTLTRYVR